LNAKKNLSAKNLSLNTKKNLSLSAKNLNLNTIALWGFYLLLGFSTCRVAELRMTWPVLR
jgi:hypothetical protein